MTRRGTIAGGGTVGIGTSEASTSAVKSGSDNSSDDVNTVGIYPQLTQQSDANRVEEDVGMGMVEPSSGNEECDDHPGVSLLGPNTTKKRNTCQTMKRMLTWWRVIMLMSGFGLQQ